MEPFFIRVFWFANTMLWIALVILYFILTNKKSLLKRGYNDKYIAFLKKSHLIRLSAIAIVLPLLELLSAWIISMITGPLTDEAQLAYIILILLVLVVPFKYFDEKINQAKMKELAIETNEKIAIDLNFKTLHMIFNPTWELLISIASLMYGIVFLNIDAWIIYIFLIFPWLMYFTLKGTKYQTRPFLKDNYNYLFVFNMFSYLFFFTYFHSYLLIRLAESELPFSESGYSNQQVQFLPLIVIIVCGFIISTSLIGRTAIYMANYKAFKMEISGSGERQTPTLVRRSIFFSIAILVLLAFSGIGILTDTFKNRNTEVGRVLSKYIIDFTGRDVDTLAVFTSTSINNLKHSGFIEIENDLEKDISYYLGNNDEKGVRLFCEIEACKTNEVRSYEICCPSTFEKVPFDTIIKFRHNSGKVLTHLINN